MTNIPRNRQWQSEEYTHQQAQKQQQLMEQPLRSLEQQVKRAIDENVKNKDGELKQLRIWIQNIEKD